MKITDLSRKMRMEFLSDRFVRHSRLGSAEQKKKRAARKHRRMHFLRLSMNKSRMERYGLDVTGHGTADVRRTMHNARKAERS